jgi:hypothetical protein
MTTALLQQLCRECAEAASVVSEGVGASHNDHQESARLWLFRDRDVLMIVQVMTLLIVHPR